MGNYEEENIDEPLKGFKAWVKDVFWRDMNNQQYLSLEDLEQLPGKVNYESPPGEFEEDSEEKLDGLDLQGR